jgi:BirA family biotin operon repressor/biotin-[acetyl-CoA-carboxylase] ligase
LKQLAGLTTESLGRNYIRFDSIGSTNDYLKENADTLPHGTVATAAVQTGGKGRLGKSWQDAPGDCLALSVLLRGFLPSELSLLPLVTGVAVAYALEEACGVTCGLKWSNDVLLGEKKVSGILCESRMAGDGSFAVAGIGINLRQTWEDFSRLGLSYAASLYSVTGKLPEEEKTAVSVLNHLERCLSLYKADGFAALLPRYRALCVNLGRGVRVTLHGAEREGVAIDVAPDGALLCEIDGVIHAINAGESSVRGIYGYI